MKNKADRIRALEARIAELEAQLAAMPRVTYTPSVLPHTPWLDNPLRITCGGSISTVTSGDRLTIWN